MENTFEERIPPLAQCADIFLTLDNQFLVQCTFCPMIFPLADHTIISDHILKVHSELENERNNNFENNCFVNIPDTPSESINCALKIQNLENLIGEYSSKNDVEEIHNSNQKNLSSYSVQLEITKLDTLENEDRITKEENDKLTEMKNGHNQTQGKSNSTISDLRFVLKSIETEDKTKPDKVLLVNGRTIFECGNCLKQFKHKLSLNLHRTIHYPFEIFQCPDCDKTFRTKSLMKKHSVAHRTEKPYKCVHCDKEFNHHANFEEHKRRSHTGQRPFKCDSCDKHFITRTERQIHQRTHTGEKPFVCEICGKKFKSSSTLKSHHDRHNTLRKFVCKVCMKAFSNRSGLNEHVPTHSTLRPHICNVCGHTFKQMKTLRQHSLIHGEKKFVCKICDKAFCQAAGLHLHMKSHAYAT